MEKTAKMGRPKKKASEVREEKLPIRISREEKKLLDKKAEELGVPLYTWARETLLKAAQRKTKS